jgi:hypothetical protein
MLTEVFSLGLCFYNQNTSGDICREWNPAPPPYDPAAEAQLIRMMPEGVPPILLFRTFVKNLAMTDAIVGWGGYELSDRLSLSLRDREILGALRSRDSRPHGLCGWYHASSFAANGAQVGREEQAPRFDYLSVDPQNSATVGMQAAECRARNPKS